MTSKADFTEDEWARLRRAPMIAGMAISIADPGGPIEITKETMATLKAASSPPSGEELLTALSQDIMAMAQRKENPVGDFKIEHSSLAANQILDELRAANQIVTTKATPEEAEGFRAWLSAVARAAADAAKEGGFMGFHAERVSEGETAMMAKVAEALSSTS
jgi:hypothetical protein